MSEPERFSVDVYYEDTDFSGVVYHPNYLRYFERAREHLLGRDELVRLWREDGVGFVVYRTELTFREGAVFGDRVVVSTVGEVASSVRAIFHHKAHREADGQLLVEGTVELVCVGRDKQLVELPASVRAAMKARFG
jgi:tol-pal system-associated acyl-CoA thioesterase